MFFVCHAGSTVTCIRSALQGDPYEWRGVKCTFHDAIPLHTEEDKM